MPAFIPFYWKNNSLSALNRAAFDQVRFDVDEGSGLVVPSDAVQKGVLTKANMLNILKHDPDLADDEVTPEYVLKNICIIGDVAECIRRLEEIWEQSGGFGTLLMITHDWDDRTTWRRSQELLAQEVVPAMPTI